MQQLTKFSSSFRSWQKEEDCQIFDPSSLALEIEVRRFDPHCNWSTCFPRTESTCLWQNCTRHQRNLGSTETHGRQTSNIRSSTSRGTSRTWMGKISELMGAGFGSCLQRLSANQLNLVIIISPFHPRTALTLEAVDGSSKVS